MQPGDQRTIHETAFVRSFIVRERRARYLSKLASRKHRRAFLDRLNHRLIEDLDSRFLVTEAPTWPDCGQCWIIADEEQYDGKLVTSAEAAEAVAAASFGIVVSFVPGELACYKDESPSDVIWLRKQRGRP